MGEGLSWADGIRLMVRPTHCLPLSKPLSCPTDGELGEGRNWARLVHRRICQSSAQDLAPME